MRKSPLLPYFEKAGWSIGDYRGVLTASTTTGDWNRRPAVFDYSWRACLLARGDDARQWLNGMVTANVRDLAPGHLAPSFLLNAKGQITATLDVLCLEADRFLLLTEETQRTNLFSNLERYIIMEDVELTDATDQYAFLAVMGAESCRVLQRSSMPVPSTTGGFDSADQAAWGRILVCYTRDEQEFEIAFSPEKAGPIWESLQQAGAIALASDAQEHERILSGTPRFGIDIRGTELPQETEQLQALHFAKGCYLGQEIVERIRSRGNVHRKFTGFQFAGLVSAGAKLQADSREVGQITSATPLPNGETFALGYIRREHGAAGTAITARLSEDESSAEVAGQVVALKDRRDAHQVCERNSMVG